MDDGQLTMENSQFIIERRGRKDFPFHYSRAPASATLTAIEAPRSASMAFVAWNRSSSRLCALCVQKLGFMSKRMEKIFFNKKKSAHRTSGMLKIIII